MADRSSSNVLAFGARQGAPKPSIPAESEVLLRACRDRLVHGLATAFAGNLGKASDDLLGMADRATSLEQQQLHFAAMDFLANRGQLLLQQFRAVYVTLFDTSLADLRRGRRGGVSTNDLGELRLVDTDDFERDLAVGKLSARATCNCANQLTALDHRLAALLQLPRISHDDNPLYPRALFAAVLRTLGDLGIGDQLALTLLHQFERQTSAALPGIYSDLNRHLVDYGILPKIPVGGPNASQHGESTDGFGDDQSPGDIQFHAGQSGPLGGAALPGAEDVFAQLARAIQAAAAPQLRSPAQAMAPLAPPAPALGVTQLIEALTTLQRGRTYTGQVPGLGSMSIDPSGGGVLQQLRATPMVSWSHPMDALTIDIVAKLFDAIFNDPDLPAALRAEIAKLQIPVLKVALMDKAFFSNKRHPARRLLDVIAGAAIGRSETDEPRLMEKIQTIVNDVVARFETDIDIFATQVKELEGFLQEEDANAQTRTTSVVGTLERRDRLEFARARVDTEIAGRIQRRNIPTLVSDFINRHWRLVLMRAFVNQGEQGAPWIDACRAMDDLLWSIEPKGDAEERSRLLARLPELLKDLRLGIEGVDQGNAWDPFFAQLVRLHVAALHKDSPQIPSQPATPESGGPHQTAIGNAKVPLAPAPEAQADASLHIDYQGEETSTPMPTETAPTDPHQQLAQSLKVGAWVEFESFRGTRKTLRLSWVSDFRGVFLFTNRQGENALTLATTSLAEHLRKGTARLLSQDRLTDRAVAQLLGKASNLSNPILN